MGLEAKEKDNSGGVRGAPPLTWPSCPSLWKVWKCFFSRWKTGHVEGSGGGRTPRGLEKYAQTGAHLSQNRRHCAPLLLTFYPSASSSFVSLSQSLISGQSTSLFLSVALFFPIFRPLFSPLPSSFVCSVSAPPVSHYSNPIYEGDKHMHTHWLSIPFSTSVSSVSFYRFIVIDVSLRFTQKKTVNNMKSAVVNNLNLKEKSFILSHWAA